MEDLYKDDPNSWLRRARFSKTVYHQPDPSQIPILKLASLKTNTNLAVTGTVSTVKFNPDSSFTGEVQGASDSEAKKTGPVSENSAISNMLKNVKETVRKRFKSPPSKQRTRATTTKSSSRPKKDSRWLQKYFHCGDRQVSALEKSSEVH